MRMGLRGQLGVFTVLFAGGMWMSKVAQPLYFEQSGALITFGVGYAVMAVVGGFSFVWGALADRLGGLNAVRIGAAIYCVGIAGRLLTDVVPVVIFAVIAGVGASLALVGIRPWVRSAASDDDIPRLVGARNFGNQIGLLIGTVGAALIFSIAATQIAGTALALSVAPVLIALAFVWVTVGAKSATGAKQDADDRDEKLDLDRRQYTSLAIKLVVIGLLSGFYVSLVAPYMPLILTSGGASASQAAISMAFMSAAQIVVSGFLSRRGNSRRPFAVFTISETVTGLLTLAAALMLDFGAVTIAVIFILRAAFVSLAVASEETIQFAVIPARATGLIFGISQSAFLVGDTLGGALGAPLWLNLGPQGLLTIAGAVALLNAVLLPFLLRTAKKTETLAVH